MIESANGRGHTTDPSFSESIHDPIRVNNSILANTRSVRKRILHCCQLSFVVGLLGGMGWSGWADAAGTQQSSGAEASVDATIRMETAQDFADTRSRTFSSFLRDSGQTTLWLDDLLARWRRAEDSGSKTRWSFELSLWLERELQRADLSELQQKYPQIWDGAHSRDRSFACVQLVESRTSLNKIAIVAFERSLRNTPPEASMVLLAEIQRRLRATADDLNQLLGEIPDAPLSLQSVQLQQLKDAAEASLAWSYYYEWLLTPTGQFADTERLKQATQIFMRLLGTTEPDLRPADWYLWFDPSRGASNDLLLGLGLCSAAMDQADVASTCFATLQRQNDARLSQRVVLWHAQGLLKRQHWDDARLLVSSYLQALRSENGHSISPLVQTMLAWFNAPGPPELPNGATDAYPPEQVAIWRWRLLEQLVLRGQIDEAARLMSLYSIRNSGAEPAGQVLLLQALLVAQPLSERSPQQLAQLTDGLRRWATANDTATSTKIPREVQRWAQQWLIRVHQTKGEVEQAREWMTRFYEETAIEAGALRQSMAWDLAQSFERTAEVDMQARRSCIRWYREAASQPNLPQTAAAHVKVRLWELADQPLAQTAYLRSISPSEEGYSFARRHLIVRLFADFQATAPGTAQHVSTATTLEREIHDQFGLTQLGPQADGPAWRAWQSQLARRLQKESEQGNDAGSAALLAVWLKTMNSMTRSTGTPLQNVVLATSVRHALEGPRERLEPWRPILYTAAMSWDQNPLLADEALMQQTTFIQLLEGSLTPLQTHALLNQYVPKRRQQWETEWKLAEVSSNGDVAIKQAPTTLGLQELYRKWWEAVRTNAPIKDPRWVEQVQLNYAEFLWRIDEPKLSKQVLESFTPAATSVPWQRQLARTLSQLNEPAVHAEAERLWSGLVDQFPPGSRDWFEAKYYLLQMLAAHDPAQAQMVYHQLRQLYPSFPSPWSDAFARVAAQYHW